VQDRIGPEIKGSPPRQLDRGEKAAEALRTYTPAEIRCALTKREIKILLLRAGVAGKAEPMTLAAIGEIFGVNGERVRAIVNASIRKLQTYREGVRLEKRQVANRARAIEQGFDARLLPKRITVGTSGMRLADLEGLVQREERVFASLGR
jgi:Sigma-70, region 4